MAENPEITKGSMVCLLADPNTRGIVTDTGSAGGIKRYCVFVDGKIKTYYEGQIFLAPKENEEEKKSRLSTKVF